jgi:hypothetical protein
MSNPTIRYPRDWFESKRLVKNLEDEFKRVFDAHPKGRRRSKELLRIMRAVYTILKVLDEAITNSEDSREIKRLLAARQVLFSWMKDKKIGGDF